MAENKKSVLLYCDIIHTVESLEDIEAGKLFKHYLRYINDLNPEAPDKLTQIVFEPIKQNLKRDLKKWEGIVVKRSEAGIASAEKRKQNQHVLTHVDMSQQASTNSTVTVNDNVTVNVNDIISNTVSKILNEAEIWTETVCMQTKLKKEALPSEVKRFVISIAGNPTKLNQKPQELRDYFTNWIKFNPNKDIKVSGPIRATSFTLPIRKP